MSTPSTSISGPCSTGCTGWSWRRNRTSFYGWQHGRDDGFASRHPHLDSGKGTLKLPLDEAAGIEDDELRAFLAAALAE